MPPRATTRSPRRWSGGRWEWSWRPSTSSSPTGCSSGPALLRSARERPLRRDRLPPVILANYATDVTLGLIVVFGGIGVVVGGIVAYIAAQAMGERAEN